MILHKLRIERDPHFWTEVASHPALATALYGLPPAFIGQIVQNPRLTPLAAQHGGVFVSPLDAVGFLYEVHAMFTPEGWGREAYEASAETAMALFASGAQVISSLEIRDNARSRPPRSFGSVPVGDWRETQIGEGRCWILTRDAWEGSPARKRLVN